MSTVENWSAIIQALHTYEEQTRLSIEDARRSVWAGDYVEAKRKTDALMTAWVEFRTPNDVLGA